MGKTISSKIILSPLKKIRVSGGDVVKICQSNISNINGFNEIYLSYINKNHIKGWKKHLKMSLNFLVIKGRIKFVFYNEFSNNFSEEILNDDYKYKISVPSGIWFGFQGLDNEKNILMNISNLIHDDEEVLSKKLTEIEYNWDN